MNTHKVRLNLGSDEEIEGDEEEEDGDAEDMQGAPEISRDFEK